MMMMEDEGPPGKSDAGFADFESQTLHQSDKTVRSYGRQKQTIFRNSQDKVPTLIRAVMAKAGSSLMGIGTATGKTRAKEAALNAIQSPLLDIGNERATGIVWNITDGSDLALFEVNAAAEVIYNLVDPTANLIFGAVIDPSLSGQVSITLIATEFKRHKESKARTMQGDLNVRRPMSIAEVTTFEIPEFLKRKGSSRYSRA